MEVRPEIAGSGAATEGVDFHTRSRRARWFSLIATILIVLTFAAGVFLVYRASLPKTDQARQDRSNPAVPTQPSPAGEQPVGGPGQPFGLKEIQEAVQQIKELTSEIHPADIVLLISVAVVQARVDDLEGALKTANALQQQARATALRCVAEVLAERGNNEEALKVVDLIKDPERRCFALGQVGQALLRRQDRAGAQIVLQQMRKAVGEIDVTDVRRRASALGWLGYAQADAGDLRGAVTSLALLIKIPPIERQFTEEMVLVQLVHAQAIAGQVESAMHTINLLPPGMHHDEAMVDIVTATAKQEGLDNAYRLNQQFISNEMYQICSLRNIARDQAEMGRGEAAHQAAAVALRIAAKLGNTIGDAKATSNAVLAQAEAGDRAKAVETAGAIREGYWCTDTLAEIARLQFAKGEPAARSTIVRARRAIKAIEFRWGVKSNAWQKVAEVEAEFGDPAEVFTWSKKIESGPERAYAFVGLVTGALKRLQGPVAKADPVAQAQLGIAGVQEDVDVWLLLANLTSKPKQAPVDPRDVPGSGQMQGGRSSSTPRREPAPNHERIDPRDPLGSRQVQGVRSSGFSRREPAPNHELIASLTKLLADPDANVRAGAAQSLGKMGATASEAVPALIRGLGDKESSVRNKVAVSLSRMGSRAVTALSEALQDESINIRLAAAQTLALCGSNAQAAVPALTEALKDSKAIVRRNAAFALGKVGPSAIDAVPALVGRLKDKDEEVRTYAAAALEAIQKNTSGRLGPGAGR